MDATGSAWDEAGTTKSFRDRFHHIYQTVIRWFADLLPADATILDFGCGGGISALRFALEHPSWAVHGIDISDAAAGLGQLAAIELGLGDLPPNLECRQVLSTVYPFDDTTFDLIFSWSVFEHVNEDLL